MHSLKQLFILGHKKQKTANYTIRSCKQLAINLNSNYTAKMIHSQQKKNSEMISMAQSHMRKPSYMGHLFKISG